MQTTKKAAALVIGNELLSGKIAEANVLVLARTLRRIGILLDRVVMVRDELSAIRDEVRLLSTSYDVVFTSGGVGPTHDDRTVEAVAEAFHTSIVQSPEVEALLRRYYAERMTEGHLRMAGIPQGARLVTTERMPWPTVVMRNVWVLPGVPAIFAMKMQVVASELGGAVAFLSRSVYTMLDEGPLKPLLDQAVAAHPGVEIGSYPRWRESRYKTKITFDACELATVQAARATFVALLPAGALVEIETGEET